MLPAVARAQFIFTTNTDRSLNIQQHTGSGRAVTIPDTTNGLPFTSIGSYQRDVEAAIAIVERNYAGYEDKRERLGSKTIDAAARRARHAAITAKTTENCVRILNEWARVFKDRHLSALMLDKDGRPTIGNAAEEAKTSRSSTAPQSIEPTARVLSDETFLITIPSFALKYKPGLDALTKEHDAEIKGRPNLIIDLRGNGGGSDPAFSSLLPYLYTQPFMEVGEDLLVTKENTDAWEALIKPISEDEERTPAGRLRAMMWIPREEKETRAWIADRVKKMRAAPEGTFICSEADSFDTLPEVFSLPSRVAILMDGQCGSTTENFLLLARQSKKATLFGQPSAGVLDYANVRFFTLPSGNCFLAIPTTRSRRLPKQPIDNIGIAPDVRIRNLISPQASGDSAVDFVQNYLRRHPPSTKL